MGFQLGPLFSHDEGDMGIAGGSHLVQHRLVVAVSGYLPADSCGHEDAVAVYR